MNDQFQVIKILVKPMGGAEINRTFRFAKQLAVAYECIVEFEFNSIKLTVDKETDKVVFMNSYYNHPTWKKGDIQHE